MIYELGFVVLHCVARLLGLYVALPMAAIWAIAIAL